MCKNIIVSTLAIILGSATAHAEEATVNAAVLRPGTHDSRHRFGIEATPFSALIKIWAIRGTYSLWSHGDLLLGYAYQNETSGDKAVMHGQTLMIGYRQFFWRGLNLEIELMPAYNPATSLIDGKTYVGWDMWIEGRIGYRFDIIDRPGFSFFVMPQFACGVGIFRTNPWPGLSENAHEPFPFPMIMFGLRV